MKTKMVLLQTNTNIWKKKIKMLPIDGEKQEHASNLQQKVQNP
jgi:hypothetical protein